MNRFSHAFSIGFELTSNHPEGEDVTPAMFKLTLLKRIADLDSTITPQHPDGEWIEAIGAPFDTHEVEPTA